MSVVLLAVARGAPRRSPRTPPAASHPPPSGTSSDQVRRWGLLSSQEESQGQTFRTAQRQLQCRQGLAWSL